MPLTVAAAICLSGCSRIGFASYETDAGEVPGDTWPGDPGGDGLHGDAAAGDRPGDAAGPCLSGVANLVIGETADDGEIELGFNTELFVDEEVGSVGTIFAGYNATIYDAPVWVFLRFGIAPGLAGAAAITSAQLRLWGNGQYAWDSATEAISIHAELSADAPQVTSRDDAPELPTGRRFVLPAVRWPASGGLSWTVGGWNTAPDLSPALQGLLAATGAIPPGSYIQLWLQGTHTTDGEIGVQDYSFNPARAARLDITWACP